MSADVLSWLEADGAPVPEEVSALATWPVPEELDALLRQEMAAAACLHAEGPRRLSPTLPVPSTLDEDTRALMALAPLVEALTPPPLPSELDAATRSALADTVLDEAVAALAPPSLPAELDRATRKQLRRATWRVVPGGARRVLGWAGAALAAAAALTLFVPAPERAGDLDGMTVKGGEGSAPLVALKVAVDRQGTVQRLDRDVAYLPGDVLYFRYLAYGPGRVTLVAVQDDTVQVLAHQPVAAGEGDLRRDDGLAAWEVEPADGGTTFALLGTGADVSEDRLRQVLERRLLDTGEVCAAAAALGATCDARELQVSP